jgi:hypothetical protein
LEAQKMGHTLTLDIPEAVYVSLLQQAQHAEKTPEEAVLAWLTSAVRRWTDDPLLQLAGCFASPVTDVSDRHNAYLGQSIQGRAYADDYH